MVAVFSLSFSLEVGAAPRSTYIEYVVRARTVQSCHRIICLGRVLHILMHRGRWLCCAAVAAVAAAAASATYGLLLLCWLRRVISMVYIHGDIDLRGGTTTHTFEYVR